MAPRLSTRDRARLREDVQYLNLEEMRTFCKKHDLSLFIHIERVDGRLRRTSDRDRKDVVLNRILAFALDGRRDGPTVYSRKVVGNGPLPDSLTPRVRVRYGQYEKHNPVFVQTLKDLTDGAFRTGMIARLVLRDFWTAGTAPTMRQFAAAWIEATAAHTSPRPEGAYLVDLARGTAGDDWKEVRVAKASRALEVLAHLV
ncbi:MAG: hypothetical protein CMJ83_09800 [Planctomycetes bacterium]|nr:hypothetical protein [Planctomycetota bacterium]